MAKKLRGKLLLSKIPKELIQTAQDGSRYAWIDVIELRTVGKYGDTHAITIYDKSKREAIFIANLREETFGASATQTNQGNSYRQPSAPAAAPVATTPEENTDLPFSH